MRLVLSLAALGLMSLGPVAVAQVSTDEDGGISAVRDPSDIPPGRQATEAPQGDGAELDDLDDNLPSSENAGARGNAELDDSDEFIPRPQAGDDQGPDAAIRDQRPARTRRTGSGAKNDFSGPRGGRPQNRWRYQYYNGFWWYWTPNNRWAFFDGRRWIDYNSELANQWARGSATPRDAMGLGGGGAYGLGSSYGATGMNGVLGRGGIGRSGAYPGLRGGSGSMAGGAASGNAGIGGAVTGEGLGSSLFGSSGGMAAVPGVSGTRGSIGGASGVGITAGRSGDASSGVGGGSVGGANIGGTGGMRGVGAGN